MKRFIALAIGVLALAPVTLAQTADEAIEKALLPAPRNMKEGATVIKWKADNTYDTLRKGTNRFTIKLDRAAAKRLAKTRAKRVKLTVRLALRDAKGNATVRSRSVTATRR